MVLKSTSTLKVEKKKKTRKLRILFRASKTKKTQSKCCFSIDILWVDLSPLSLSFSCSEIPWAFFTLRRSISHSRVFLKKKIDVLLRFYLYRFSSSCGCCFRIILHYHFVRSFNETCVQFKMKPKKQSTNKPISSCSKRIFCTSSSFRFDLSLVSRRRPAIPLPLSRHTQNGNAWIA